MRCATKGLNLPKNRMAEGFTRSILFLVVGQPIRRSACGGKGRPFDPPTLHQMRSTAIDKALPQSCDRQQISRKLFILVDWMLLAKLVAEASPLPHPVVFRTPRYVDVQKKCLVASLWVSRKFLCAFNYYTKSSERHCYLWQLSW